jgi:hypothetical protein
MKAFETLTIRGTAVPLTSSIYDSPTTREHANRAMVTVETSALRYRVDGNDPTASVGILAYVGDVIVLEDFNEIRLFKAVKVTDDSTITVDYR